MFSLYIHIPFCEKKCNYCNFYIVPAFDGVDKMKDNYLNSIKKELLFKKKLFSNQKIYTIYVGGGTPCELGLNRTLELFKFIENNFDISECEEISFELNPNPLSQSLEFISVLQQFLPNFRFSVGIQSLENNVLKISGRNYDYELIENFMENVETYNCRLNLDFISFGIENNLEIFDIFLKKYSNKISSISVYTLELFDGSLRNNYYKTDEDKILDNFQKYLKILTKHNYQRYEISNFSKKGQESKHNQVYWRMLDYLGIGTSASSFFNKTRYTNAPTINKYINGIFQYSEEKQLSQSDLLIEKIFLNLRTKEGLELENDILGFLDLDKINIFLKEKCLKKQNNKLFFTNKGFLLYNHIITEILTEI